MHGFRYIAGLIQTTMTKMHKIVPHLSNDQRDDHGIAICKGACLKVGSFKKQKLHDIDNFVLDCSNHLHPSPSILVLCRSKNIFTKINKFHKDFSQRVINWPTASYYHPLHKKNTMSTQALSFPSSIPVSQVSVSRPSILSVCSSFEKSVRTLQSEEIFSMIVSKS